jgi:hypothetical protein
MAEGRMLKKKVSTSKRLAALNTDSARLLWTWMNPFLDVEGRASADPHVIKGAIFPRIITTTPEMITEWLDDLDRVGLIARYFVDGDCYLVFRKFKDEQNLRPEREAESHIPPPPKGLTFNSLPNSSQTPVKLPHKLMEGKGRECKLMKGNRSHPSTPIRASAKNSPCATDPRIKVLVDYHFQKWGEKQIELGGDPTEKYAMDAPKEPVAFKRLLKQLDDLHGEDSLERIKGLLDRYFTIDDPFIQGSGHSISLFCKVINKLKRPPKRNEPKSFGVLREMLAEIPGKEMVRIDTGRND